MRQLLILITLILLHSYAPAQTSPRVALVLSGGGALGYAHIGALQAMDEVGLKPTAIAGTSIGAIIGAVYSQGYTGNQLYDILKEYRLYSLSRNVHASLKHPGRGIGSFKKVRQMLLDVIPHNSFDSLQIPFLCVATNIRTGQAMVRTAGNNLAEWVLASASIPIIFKPQLINGDYYCDGGLVDNLPATHLSPADYDVCIGIDLVPMHTTATEDYFTNRYLINNVYGNMVLSINSQQGRKICTYIIQPHNNIDYGILDFRHYETLRQRGYEATKQFLQQHPELVSSSSRN